MWKTLLGLKENQEIVGFDLRFSGSWIVAGALVLAILALAVYLYRSESKISGARRWIMGTCQALTLLLLMAILFTPVIAGETTYTERQTVLVLLDSSASMAIEDEWATPQDIGEVAKVTGKVPFDEKVDDTNVDAVRRKLSPSSRFDLARVALSHPQIKLLDRLNKHFNVRLMTFDRRITPENSNEGKPFSKSKAAGESSRIGEMLEDAVARYRGQRIAGVVVLSDFAQTEGNKTPGQVARSLRQQSIPVYTVPIGLPKPKDVRVRSVIAPEVAFKGDHVPIRVQIESAGLEGRVVDLTLKVNGEQKNSQKITLKEGVQFAEMKFTPTQGSGKVKLELSVTTLEEEKTRTKNNTASHQVQIIDQKIKVLYIEGMPRWEYRYLRWVLLRDPRLEVQFLMTEGDKELAKISGRHLATFPQVAKDAFKYDLIILGDVRASYFKEAQLALIKDLVRKRGGSLLMVAGPVGSPASYKNSQLAEILPVRPASGLWESVTGGPVVTAAGKDSQITRLSNSPEADARIWSRVSPMYLPPLEGAKPGATVLLSRKKKPGQLDEYPLVAWQRFGTGKSMFVATEDLWRMRLEVGDRYHARFWGQAIQFLALSRLLGKNKQISLETNKGTFSAGEEIQIFANVLDQSFAPRVLEEYTVEVKRKGSDEPATQVVLSPVPGTPGLHSGVMQAREDGSYQLKAKSEDAEISNAVDFEIHTVPMEEREPAMQPAVARRVAEQSGGKNLSLTQLKDVPSLLGEPKVVVQTAKSPIDLWDKPIVFLLLLLFAGIEWYMRRKENLV